MSERRVRLYEPTAEPRVVTIKLARRPAALARGRAGILDNGKANAGTLMLAAVERLRQRHGVAEVLKREKPVAGPPSDGILADLTTCDFVLVGSAD